MRWGEDEVSEKHQEHKGETRGPSPGSCYNSSRESAGKLWKQKSLPKSGVKSAMGYSSEHICGQEDGFACEHAPSPEANRPVFPFLRWAYQRRKGTCIPTRPHGPNSSRLKNSLRLGEVLCKASGDVDLTPHNSRKSKMPSLCLRNHWRFFHGGREDLSFLRLTFS